MFVVHNRLDRSIFRQRCCCVSKSYTCCRRLLLLYIVMLGVIQSVSSLLEGSIGELHFTIPDEAKNFDDAVSLCKNNYNSTLAVVNNTDTQTALQQFLDAKIMTLINPTMFINIRLNAEQTDTWYLINGSKYIGGIGNLNPIDGWWTRYLLYCHLQNDPGGDRNHYLVVASTPGESRNYICQYDENRCYSDSARNIVYMGSCYVKYENESLTWYQARERCVNDGGDLATFLSNPSDSWLAPFQFNTSWLKNSSTYWVGIRDKNLSWKYTYDSNTEAIFTWWSDGKPNNYNYSCVCVDPNGNPPWSWTDCDCSLQRQFVCLKKVAIQTTTIMTSHLTTTAGMTNFVTKAVIKLNTIADTNQTASAAITGLSQTTTIGLAVGIGGGGLIVLIILIVVLVVVIKRRQREKSSSKNKCVNHFVNATSDTQARGSAEAPASGAHYEHLKSDNGPGSEIPLYDQLNQAESQEYEQVL